MSLNAEIQLWQLLVFAGTAIFAFAVLSVKVMYLSGEVSALRSDIDKIEKDAKDDRLRQGDFERTVTDRLARIETTLGTFGDGLHRIESAIRQALKS